jgi:hypothetical protein
MKKIQIPYVPKAKPVTRYNLEVKQLKINNIQQHTHLLSSQNFVEDYSLATLARSLRQFRAKRIFPAAN